MAWQEVPEILTAAPALHCRGEQPTDDTGERQHDRDQFDPPQWQPRQGRPEDPRGQQGGNQSRPDALPGL